MQVSYWDRKIKQVSYDQLSLEEMFKKCDVIFLTLQVNDETKKLITDDLLRSMRKSCIFISCTGKKLFNNDIVEQMTAKNEIFGYAFEEPDVPIEHYQGNTMVTSEYGWFTKEATKRRLDYWYDGLAEFVSGYAGIPRQELLGRGSEVKFIEPAYCNIRKAKMSDIQTIAELYESQGWMGENNSIEKICDNYAQHMDSDKYFLLVAEHKGKVIGTVQANINNAAAFDCKDFMVMDYLVVQKKYRRRKVGTQLVSRLFEICTARGLESVWLDSSQGRVIAHKFYKTMQFDDPVKGFRKTF